MLRRRHHQQQLAAAVVCCIAWSHVCAGDQKLDPPVHPRSARAAPEGGDRWHELWLKPAEAVAVRSATHAVQRGASALVLPGFVSAAERATLLQAAAAAAAGGVELGGPTRPVLEAAARFNVGRDLGAAAEATSAAIMAVGSETVTLLQVPLSL